VPLQSPVIAMRLRQGTSGAASGFLVTALIAVALFRASLAQALPYCVVASAISGVTAAAWKPVSWIGAALVGAVVSVVCAIGAIGLIAYAVSRI
jgi:hypothetical protein